MTASDPTGFESWRDGECVVRTIGDQELHDRRESSYRTAERFDGDLKRYAITAVLHAGNQNQSSGNSGQLVNNQSELVEDFEQLPALPVAAWVVANGQGNHWRMWGDSGPEWTPDRDKALQFVRRADAEAFSREDEDAWLIQPVHGLPRPSDDDLWDKTMQDRDRYHEIADSLADGIAEHFGAEIGEHSSANCPWENALELLATRTHPTALRTPTVEVGIGDEARLREYPKLLAFFSKHALGTLTAPSCLCCGKSTQGIEIGVQHLELPAIVICAPCHTTALRSKQEPL